MNNNTAKPEEYAVETCHYWSDFQVLSLKEKLGILKNAQNLLKLQKEHDVFCAETPLVQREHEKSA